MVQQLSSMQLRKAARIILVGAPGVGKGTQSERMLKRFPQLSSISSGDLLRENVRNQTALGIQAQSIMKSGGLVPDTTILMLIRSELTNRGWLKRQGSPATMTLNTSAISIDSLDAGVGSKSEGREYFDTQKETTELSYEYDEHPNASFILDGFPRTAAQAQSLAALLPINLVVNIETPKEVVLDRICNRWIHEASGRVYNTTFNAPKEAGKDDITGDVLVQRDDDKPEVWKSRLARFEETSLPLLEHYDKLGVLWTVQGNTSDEISPKLFEEFGKRFGS